MRFLDDWYGVSELLFYIIHGRTCHRKFYGVKSECGVGEVSCR